MSEQVKEQEGVAGLTYKQTRDGSSKRLIRLQKDLAEGGIETQKVRWEPNGRVTLITTNLKQPRRFWFRYAGGIFQLQKQLVQSMPNEYGQWVLIGGE